MGRFTCFATRTASRARMDNGSRSVRATGGVTSGIPFRRPALSMRRSPVSMARSICSAVINTCVTAAQTSAAWTRGIPGRSAATGAVSLVCDAAFVLNSKTYLFGGTPGDNSYVRYSSRDYTRPDEGYPQKTDDNWWNLPVALVERGFNLPPEDPAVLGLRPDGFRDRPGRTATTSTATSCAWRRWSNPCASPSRPSTAFPVARSRWTGRDGPSTPIPTSTVASRERPRASCSCRSSSRRTSRGRIAGRMRPRRGQPDKRVVLPPKEAGIRLDRRD